jgi:hypothetical protein
MVFFVAQKILCHSAIRLYSSIGSLIPNLNDIVFALRIAMSLEVQSDRGY